MSSRTIQCISTVVGFWLGMAFPAFAAWEETLAVARGQTVFWNAWGGDQRTNAFITWVGTETERRFGVKVQQVKLTNTSEAVARVISEKAAGRHQGGSIDLIWINGPNFLSMKGQGLLFGPFVDRLPNSKFVDLTPTSPASIDFTVPVEGFESPWRLAKFVFVYDSARLTNPPRSMIALGDWAAANPGRFTHPDPSNFMGATFLKQALIEFAADRGVLQVPMTEAAFAAQTAPLWDWYDRLRPQLWRKGATFPKNQSAQQQMLNDNEIDLAMSFDPSSAAAAVEQGLLPKSARVFTPDVGSIGNVSFVAIPYNAANKEGAMVVANFLLEPGTQARQQDITVLGSLSVLSKSRLSEEDRRRIRCPPENAVDALGSRSAADAA